MESVILGAQEETEEKGGRNHDENSSGDRKQR